MEWIVEPQKQIPVTHDVDVAVAGAGVAGIFAAIAAARHGARTVLSLEYRNCRANRLSTLALENRRSFAIKFRNLLHDNKLKAKKNRISGSPPPGATIISPTTSRSQHCRKRHRNLLIDN